MRKIILLFFCLLSLGAGDYKVSSLTNGLVLWVPMTSAYIQSTTVASDRSMQGHHLTAIGTPPTIGADGVNFNGTSDYLYRAVDDFRGGDNIGSICAWFKVSSDDVMLFSTSDEVGANNFFRAEVFNGSIRLAYKDGASAYVPIGTVTGLDDGGWHYACFTSNGSRYLFYVDGSPDVVTGPDNGKWLDDIPARDNISVGALVRNTTTYFDGKAAFLSIYDREVSPAEVSFWYKVGRRVLVAKISTSGPDLKVTP